MGCSSSAGPEQQTEVKRDSNKQKKVSCPKSFHDNYLLGSKVGRGAFAQVRLTTKAQVADSSQVPKEYPYAAKIIDLRDKVEQGEINKSQQKAVQSEANVWRDIGKHPNCINLIDAFWGDCLCYFVMERCKCDLLTALQGESELNEKIFGKYFYQMAQGMAHCHSVGIVHRDIKPDNFLVGGPEGNTVKLGDFGLSASMPKTGGLRGVFGTAPFMCPEMLGSRPYDEKADVWSYAVIVYVLLFGTFPYMPKEQSSKGMKEAILNGRPPPRYEPTSRANKTSRTTLAMEFVQSLLIRENNKRPTADEVLQMPFLVQANTQTGQWPAELPSLRPMLHAAKKVGAFENRDTSNCDTVDHLLHKLQMKHQNVPLPMGEKDRNRHRSRDEERLKDDIIKQHSKKVLPGGISAHTSGDPDNWDTSSTRSSNGHSSVDFTFQGSGWSKGTSNFTTPTSRSGSDGLPMPPIRASGNKPQ